MAAALPVVAIDVDEVLAAFLAGLSAYMNETHGTALQPSSFPTYSFIDAPGFAASPPEAFARDGGVRTMLRVA